MARKRKPRRRMVYSYTFGFHDGAVIGAGPNRKPSEKRVKSDGLWIDDDSVFQEYLYSPTDWCSWEPEKRTKTVEVLANRLNTRRAIRELVLPELRSLHQSIELLRDQLDRIERKIDQDVG